MAFGLRVRKSGAVVLDITDRLSRELGEHTLTSSPTSLDISSMADGDAWFYVKNQSYSFGASVGNGSTGDTITVSGSVISWPASYAGTVIIYGCR